LKRIWTRLDSLRFGLANRISDAIATVEWREPGSIANIRQSSEVLVGCDFAGSHKSANFEAFAFLVGAVAGSGKWMQERQRVREELLSDGRRMAYKHLNDRRRQKALSPFLAAANSYPGSLFVFLVSKKISELFDDPGDQVLFPELIVAERTWKSRPFRRLLLIATLGSILVSGLCDPAQDILWITDEDEIAPNPKQHDHAGHVIHHCISTYAPAHSGLLVFLTTEANVNDLMTEDVVAIPDLAAGALVDAFSSGDRPPCAPLWMSASNDLTLKSKSILSWLAERQQSLRRLVVVLDRSADSTIEVSAFSPFCDDNGLVYLIR